MKTTRFSILLILIVTFVFYKCSEDKKFIIKGHFRITDPTSIQLFFLSEQTSQLIDSVFTNTNRFTLEGNINRSGIYLMKFFNEQSIYLVIHPGDRIRVDIDNTGNEITYYVEDSPDSKRIKELTDKQDLLLKQIDELSREWEKHQADTTMRYGIDSAYAALIIEHKQYSRNFIHENPRSLANILALYQNFGRKSQPLFDKYDDLGIFNFVDSNLVPVYPETEAVKVLNREVNQLKKEIEHNRYIEKIITAGRLLPAFRYPDINGDTLKAGFSQGNPSLLYFWATWNPYSVKELLAINDFAKKLQSSDITFITVALDTSEKELRTFLSANNIGLSVVCDYSYWDSDLVGRYAIKKIPATVISNKQGLIVGIDLFNQELVNLLNDLNR